MTAHIIGNQANFVGLLNLRFDYKLVPVIFVLRERITMKKKKELDVNITLEKYNRFKHTVRIVDQPNDDIGNKYLHDGNVFLEIADEENNVHINIDKNVFDLVILTYLQGRFIRYTNGIIKGQLRKRIRELITELDKRESELEKEQREATQKRLESTKG